MYRSLGTAGQRCTSTRRLIVHEAVEDDLIKRLVSAYKQVNSDPLEGNTLMGPLVNEDSVLDFNNAIKEAKDAGGEIVYGGCEYKESTNFVLPTIIKAENKWEIVQEETFYLILYVMTYKNIQKLLNYTMMYLKDYLQLCSHKILKTQIIFKFFRFRLWDCKY